MPKVWVEGQITSSNSTMDIKAKGLLTKKRLTFQNEKDQTKYSFNFDISALTRENEEMEMTYYFETPEDSFVRIKELNHNMFLPMEIKRIEKGKNTFLVEYNLEQQSFLFTLKIKEIASR